jgi:two-component system response regulator HydG
MAGNYLALVANDAYLATVREEHGSRIFDQAPLICSFEAIREQLGRDSHGILLLVAADPADCEPIKRLVQEINLRKLPAVIILLVADQALESRLAFLNPYILKCLHWPEDAVTLGDLLADGLEQAGMFPDTVAESVAEILSRRLLTQTPSLLPLLEHLVLAATHDITVLLIGETGTGKSYLARLMHECSPRREQRFLTIPCGAIAPTLVESEFFGHVQGAFTGADRPKLGKFAAVGSGTLFLDEIDALGLEQQAALLRVIETGEFEPVGSNETQHTLARLIFASNVNLEAEVRRGKFRQDLYYRLNVMAFHLPPLRERREDIAPLVRALVARFNQRFRKELFDIRPETLAALEAFSWPGNIRQLENVIQHAVLVSGGRELLLQHLPPPILDEAALSRSHSDLGNEQAATASLLRHNRELLEHNLIQRVLVDSGYSLNRTAHTLGISRVTLYKKMKKYGLHVGGGPQQVRHRLGS